MLLVACTVFPLHGLYDEYIAPKWYAAGYAALLAEVAGTYRIMKGMNADADSTKALSVSALAAIAFNVLCCVAVCRRPTDSVLDIIPFHGTFDNPSGFALNMCLLISLAVSGWHGMGRRMRCAVTAGVVIAGMMVLLSGSRTGAACMAVVAVCLFSGSRRVARSVKLMVAALAAAAVLVTAMSVKTESTSGRSFIISRTWELIRQQPLTGYGWHGFEREYMPHQAGYFKIHPDNDAAWLADNISHPLNEWMYVWVDFGIAGPVLLLLMLGIPAAACIAGNDQRMRGMLPSVAVIAMFATTGYPHIYPLPWMVLAMVYAMMCRRYVAGAIRHRWCAAVLTAVCLAGMAALTAEAVTEHRWYRLTRGMAGGHAAATIDGYERLSRHYAGNPRFIYSKMFALYQARRFDKAADTYETLSHMVATYDMELLMGDICLHDGKPGRSLSHYTRAMYMVPVRFAPLDGQLRAYSMMGDTLRADSVARVIMGKRVKVPSAAVEQMRHEAREWLDGGGYEKSNLSRTGHSIGGNPLSECRKTE